MGIERRRARTESGSILVELALVVPVLMLLVAGMIEVGAAWRDKSTVIQASRQGARVASHLGRAPESDMEALLAVLSVMPQGTATEGLSKDLAIKKVVIYDADLTAGEIASCIGQTSNGGIADDCNVYIKGSGGSNDRLLPSNLTDSNFKNGSWDNDWSPEGSSHRSDSLLGATNLGVYIEADRPMLTNIFPGQQSQKITAFTVMRLEPPTP